MRAPGRVLVAVALALAVGLAAGASPFASAAPDGLERVAAEGGFADREAPHGAQADAPLGAYRFPGIRDERLATGVAGFVGTLGAFAAACAVALALRRRPRVGPARRR